MRIFVPWLLFFLLACQTGAPDFSQPSSWGTEPAQSVQKAWRYRPGDPPQNDAPCGANRFTASVVQEPVTCDPETFDFTAMVTQALAQRDAIFGMIVCAPRCSRKYTSTNGLIASCENEGRRAEVRIDGIVTCSPVAIEPPPPSITVPQPFPPGQYVDVIDMTFRAGEVFEETFPRGPIGCDEAVQLDYREPVPNCRIRNYQPFNDRAMFQVMRRHERANCAQGCARRLAPEIVFKRWGCNNNEVLVEVVFKPCRANR